MYNIIYNNTTPNVNTSTKHKHQYLPTSSKHRTEHHTSTIHHSRHPSDNLCGVRLSDEELNINMCIQVPTSIE